MTSHKATDYVEIVIELRIATLADLKLLAAIDSVCFEDQQRYFQIENWIINQSCYLLEIEGKIKAYAVLNYHFFDYGFIEMLMVDKNVRRNGIGQKMINYLQTICLSPKLFTSTNQSNKSMQQLLKQAGFKESGYIDNLDENDPELIFFYSVK